MAVQTRSRVVVDRKVVSPFPDVVIPNLPVHTLVFQKLAERGQQVALVDGVSGREYTANELRASCLRVAGGLRRIGLRQGETLTIFSGNSVQFVIISLATLAAGGIFSTANSNFREGELEVQLLNAGTSWIYTTLELLPLLRRVVRKLPKLKGIIVDKKQPTLISFDVLDAEAELTDEHVTSHVKPREDVAAILYSSGTTGLPKGTMLTHTNIISYAFTMGVLRRLPNESQPRELLVMPQYHIYGLACVTYNAFINSVFLVLLPRFQPEQFLATLEKYGITSLPLVPPIVVFLVKSPLASKYDLSSLRTVWCGAAPLGVETEQLFHQKYPKAPVRQGWGLTETTGVGLVVPGTFPQRPGASGVVTLNAEMKVIDPSGQALSSGEVGEILCRGPYVMKGYLNNEQATTEMIDKDGFLHTGDVGYYDDDGYFYIVDRIKELIKYKGSQVAPAELEALILTHPAVADVGVVGVPDVEAGEVPRAYVVVKDGHQLTQDQLKAFVKEKAAYFKQLRGGVVFMDEIPKSPSGKILRRNLRKLVQGSKL